MSNKCKTCIDRFWCTGEEMDFDECPLMKTGTEADYYNLGYALGYADAITGKNFREVKHDE